jgi:hypothetical protein
VSDLLARVWNRIREAYEARLLQDAEGSRQPTRSYLVTAHDPETGASRVVLRGPRALPVGSWFLRPEVLQFALPVTVVELAAWFGRSAFSGPAPLAWIPALLVGGGITLAWNTFVARLIFRKRWKRLREEAYDAWTFRLAAAHEAQRLAGPDDATARRREELDELVRPSLPRR